MTLKMQGFRELGERFARLSTEMQVSTARSATNAAAQVIKKLAILKAPEAPSSVSPDVPAKNLKNNIRVKRLADTPLTSEHIVYVRSGKKAFYASRYGSIQEYGSVKQGKQSFMRPAIDEGKGRAVEAIRTKIIEGVHKAGK